MSCTYTLTGAPMKDEDGDDFIVISLPSKYITSDEEREAWQDHFRRQFSFPVVIAFGHQEEKEWTLRGQSRLLQLLADVNIDNLPWEIVSVTASEPPPELGGPPPLEWL